MQKKKMLKEQTLNSIWLIIQSVSSHVQKYFKDEK